MRRNEADDSSRAEYRVGYISKHNENCHYQRLMYQINDQGVLSHDAQQAHWRRFREVGQGKPAPISPIKDIAKEDAYKDYAKPGKNRNIVQSVKFLRGQAQPEEPGSGIGLRLKE
jgi:hypothetical protein